MPQFYEQTRGRICAIRLSIYTTATVTFFATVPAVAQWPQWGGPNRNFTVETTGLADKWSWWSGPRKLWRRELGDGYSSIVYDNGVLFTMYRTEPTANEERVVALDSRTGRTVWEYVNPAPLWVQPDARWGGLGPNSTPLIVANRLFAVGSNAMMLCLDKTTGKALWSHDLVLEYGAPFPNKGEVGYSASPIAYQNVVVVPVGRKDTADAPKGQSLIAFEQISGKVAWKSLSFKLSESSPILINFSGEDQLVFHAGGELVGVAPNNGDPLWRHPIPDSSPIVTPVWDGQDLLVCAAGGQSAVTRGIRLVRRGAQTVPEEVWASSKLRIFLPTPVLVDDFIFGSTERVFLGADVKTGERTWVQRGFKNASCVYADGKLIILNEDGQLSLATTTSDGLTIHSQCRITERYSFTAPTLVGTTLYVRDRKHLMAFDLGMAGVDGD